MLGQLLNLRKYVVINLYPVLMVNVGYLVTSINLQTNIS